MAQTHPAFGETPSVAAQGRGGSWHHVSETLARRMGWVILTTVLFVGVASGYVWQRDRSYVAATQILFERPSSDAVDGDGAVPPQLGAGIEGFLESQSRLILSDEVLSRVIDSEALALDGEFNGADAGLVDRLRLLMAASVPASQAADHVEPRVLDALRRASRTAFSADSLAITVEVTTRDREKSARLANAITETYMASEIESQSGPADHFSRSIEERLSALRRDLMEAEERTAKFGGENSFSETLTASVDDSNLAELERKRGLAEVQADEAGAVLSRIDSIRSPGDVRQGLPRDMQTEITRQLVARYATARQTQAALSLQLLDKHPDMQTANIEVESVGQAIMVELGRIRARVQAAFDRAVEQRQTLENKIGKAGGGNAERLSRFRALQRDEDARRARYLTFLAQVRIPEQEAPGQAVTARILSAATPPMTPAGPSNFVIIALGLAFGLVSGCGAAFAKDTRDARVHSVPALNQATRLPVIATVPITTDAPDAPDSAGLLPFCQIDPSSPSSLSVYSLVDSLLEGVSKGNRKTILFTAPDQNHGRTTISLNVALAAANRGERVLLIDGDLARRTLSVARYQDPSLGLAGALENVADVSDCIQRDRSGLFAVLPVGRPRGKAQPLTASSEAVRQKVEELLDDYSLVVVDAGTMADDDGPGPYAGLCDFAVLIVRRGEGKTRDAAQAASKLTDRVSAVAGCVLVADEGG